MGLRKWLKYSCIWKHLYTTMATELYALVWKWSLGFKESWNVFLCKGQRAKCRIAGHWAQYTSLGEVVKHLSHIVELKWKRGKIKAEWREQHIVEWTVQAYEWTLWAEPKTPFACAGLFSLHAGVQVLSPMFAYWMQLSELSRFLHHRFLNRNASCFMCSTESE